jgi:uncharacterized membrane protein YdjX (TVP38/TMEM64 family)
MCLLVVVTQQPTTLMAEMRREIDWVKSFIILFFPFSFLSFFLFLSYIRCPQFGRVTIDGYSGGIVLYVCSSSIEISLSAKK